MAKDRPKPKVPEFLHSGDKSSLLPQQRHVAVSPYFINLIFSDLPLVAAGTERNLSGVNLRIRGTHHRCIGMVRRVGWSPNYIREEHVR